ncbi:hypothetical protein ABIA27_004102 [Sinorhizobium fredii]
MKSAPSAVRISVVEATTTPPASQTGSKASVAATLGSGTRVTPLIEVKCRTHIARTSSSVGTISLRAPSRT